MLLVNILNISFYIKANDIILGFYLFYFFSVVNSTRSLKGGKNGCLFIVNKINELRVRDV